MPITRSEFIHRTKSQRRETRNNRMTGEAVAHGKIPDDGKELVEAGDTNCAREVREVDLSSLLEQ
jgi:hypothetical protein